MGNQGVSLTNRITEAKLYADMIFKAGMAPECYKTSEALAVAMLRGAEMGITYSESVGNLYVVKNVVSLNTKALVYMFEKHGGMVELLEWDADHCKIRLSQRGRAPLVVAFTLAECKNAGWNIGPDSKEKFTWAKMPRVMVKNRTITNGIKAYSPTSEFVRTFDPDMADEATDELETPDDVVDSKSVRVIEQAVIAAITAPDTSRTISPTPNAGYDTWPAPKQERFKRNMEHAGLSEDDVMREFGVASMHEWMYSSEQTRPIIEVLKSYPDITVAEKKRVWGIDKLADIVLFGWDSEDCNDAISDSIEAAK